MDTTTLDRPGLQEIGGADVFGGAGPVAVWLVKVIVPIVVASVVANWADFKDGVFDGYNDATH